MTLNEFKAFLEGYEASFVDGVPTAEQYAVIKEKLATVTVPIEYKTVPYVGGSLIDYPRLDRIWYEPNTSKDPAVVAPFTQIC